jgi:hypothetical protein
MPMGDGLLRFIGIYAQMEHWAAVAGLILNVYG